MIQAGIPTLTRRCSGPVLPASFVTKAADPTQPGAVKAATANSIVFGVAFGGTLNSPGLAAALFGIAVPDVAGNSGDDIPVYSIGDICLVYTATGFADGDLLESDANSYAITSTVAGHNVGGQALETVPAGSYGLMRVFPGIR